MAAAGVQLAIADREGLVTREVSGVIRFGSDLPGQRAGSRKPENRQRSHNLLMPQSSRAVNPVLPGRRRSTREHARRAHMKSQHVDHRS